MEVQKPGRQTILVILIIFVSPFAVHCKDWNFDMLALLYILALSGTAIRAAPNAWFYTGQLFLPLPRLVTGSAVELNCTTPEGRDSNPNWDDYSKRLTTGRNKCWKKEWDWNTKDGARRRAIWIDKKGKKDKGCLWLYEDSECINKPDVMEFDPNSMSLGLIV